MSVIFYKYEALHGKHFDKQIVALLDRRNA